MSLSRLQEGSVLVQQAAGARLAGGSASKYDCKNVPGGGGRAVPAGRWQQVTVEGLGDIVRALAVPSVKAAPGEEASEWGHHALRCSCSRLPLAVVRGQGQKLQAGCEAGGPHRGLAACSVGSKVVWREDTAPRTGQGN